MFMDFLIGLKDLENLGGIWKSSFKILLTEIILFGYGLRRAAGEYNDVATSLSMQYLSKLFAGELEVCLDSKLGRILSISNTENNEFIDLDNDDFPEILRINKDYIGKIIHKDQIDQFLQNTTGEPQDWFDPNCSNSELSPPLENEKKDEGANKVYNKEVQSKSESRN